MDGTPGQIKDQRLRSTNVFRKIVFTNLMFNVYCSEYMLESETTRLESRREMEDNMLNMLLLVQIVRGVRQ